jgi:hypothetical protein
MAQQKNHFGEQPSRTEEAALPVDGEAAEGELYNIRFAFAVWLAVFSILAASILWDSVYGMLFRHPPA